MSHAVGREGPRVFQRTAPFPAWASKGERAQGNRRDLKITVTFRAFCKRSDATVQQNRDSTKKTTINPPTKSFCKDWQQWITYTNREVMWNVPREKASIVDREN